MRLQNLFSHVALVSAVTARNCTPAAIQSLLPSNATVNFAYPLAANSTFQSPAGDLGYPTNPVGLPALCAIGVQVQSIGNTTFGFGLFLPTDWNGRFLAVGNGGFAGGVNWLDMGPGARYGFATMSTDTGHNSTSSNGTWAYQQPDKVENWGHLAMHGSVVAAKSITAGFYGESISYNYYSGCSTGGRQGLKEAESYPEDFDGIVAGAPAWWTTHLQTWTVKVGLYNLPTTADHHIPAALFPVIGAEVLKQCDPQDGVTDSIISNPSGCNFRPEALLCGTNATNATASNATASNATANCLTNPQIDTLYHIYNDWVGENQTFFFPHLNPGSESLLSWPLLANSAPSTLGTDYVKYFLGQGPNWDFYNFTEADVHLSDQINPGNATVNPNKMGAFQKKGGKLLSYHGLADPLIPTGSTPYFYNHVYRNLQPQGVDIDSFYRFFFVPGMGHCTGTALGLFDAPWYFAGPNQPPTIGPLVYSVPGYSDAQHDVILAMVDWVEKGKAPDYIIGTKYVNETTVTQSGNNPVMRQRPLCMYPKVAKFSGTGDVNSAASWTCQSPY